MQNKINIIETINSAVAAAAQENNAEPQVLSETDDGKVILKKDDEPAKVSLEKDNEPVKVNLEKKEEA